MPRMERREGIVADWEDEEVRRDSLRGDYRIRTGLRIVREVKCVWSGLRRSQCVFRNAAGNVGGDLVSPMFRYIGT